MTDEAIDPRELCKALGTFMTGVTVITTVDEAGRPRGFTANSFTSVSLDPPLVLVCVDHKAHSYPTWAATDHFGVNFLAEEQREVSGIFAGKTADKFSHVSWSAGRTGSPLINGSLAWVDCRVHKRVEAGDHLVLIGEVVDFHYTPANPLGYFRGAYLTSGLEHDAMPSPGQRTRVGAILEADGHILLVEDVVINQRVAQRMLEQAGHAVTVAENGQHALEHLARTTFDLVLMDIQMPVMNGFEATARIRAAESAIRDLPIIAVTAHTLEGDRERCLEAGMNGYVPKPIRATDLLQAIDEVVGLVEAPDLQTTR